MMPGWSVVAAPARRLVLHDADEMARVRLDLRRRPVRVVEVLVAEFDIAAGDAPVPEAALGVLAVELAVVHVAGIALPAGPDLLRDALIARHDLHRRRRDAIGPEGRRRARRAARQWRLLDVLRFGEEEVDPLRLQKRSRCRAGRPVRGDRRIRAARSSAARCRRGGCTPRCRLATAPRWTMRGRAAASSRASPR